MISQETVIVHFVVISINMSLYGKTMTHKLTYDIEVMNKF